LPLTCINDATAACAGEIVDDTVMAYMALGTGIGSKIAVGKNVLVGHHGAAGEVGHVVFKPGVPCLCGLDGCTEAYAGWGGLQRQWNQLHDTPLTDPTALLEHVRYGDAIAMELWDQAMAAVAHAATCLIASVDPARLVLGGGLSVAWGDPLLAGVVARLPHQSYTGQRTPVVMTTLYEQAALLGVAAIARGDIGLR
jgi:glucokinase